MRCWLRNGDATDIRKRTKPVGALETRLSMALFGDELARAQRQGRQRQQLGFGRVLRSATGSRLNVVESIWEMLKMESMVR